MKVPSVLKVALIFEFRTSSFIAISSPMNFPVPSVTLLGTFQVPKIASESGFKGSTLSSFLQELKARVIIANANNNFFILFFLFANIGNNSLIYLSFTSWF